MSSERHVEYLLIGGGLASASCARWLREAGAEGSILLLGRETDLPYNRPPCSKEYLRGSDSREDTHYRPAEWYAEQQIEVQMRCSVSAIDPGERTVKLVGGKEISFGQALVATGAGVRRLDVPGAELEGIHYLRTLGNADSIRADAAGKRVVLIGGSYIGTEVAASLTELGSSCTIVMIEPVVLSRTFGESAGRFFADRLTEHGITIHGGEELERFEGTDGRVARVVTKSGLVVDADAVVIGAGSFPDVGLAKRAGLEIGERGGIKLDSRLASSAAGVYAAGDVAEYESVVHGRQSIRIEHWDVALNQGRVAALNMLGRDEPYDVVPYFFSDLSDWASLEYVGPAFGWDQEIVRGSLDEGDFSVWYLQEGRVAAALSVGRSEDLQHARRLIASSAAPAGGGEALADLGTNLADL